MTTEPTSVLGVKPRDLSKTGRRLQARENSPLTIERLVGD